MITQQEYHSRRRKLAKQLPGGAAAVIASAEGIIRNGDAHYRFRQASDFYYLTGFNEPGALLIIVDNESYLFNQPSNPAEEQWTGHRLGQEEACSQLGMKAAFSNKTIAERLPELFKDKTAIYFSLSNEKLSHLIFQALNTLKSQIRKGVKAPSSLCDLDPVVSELRLFKSEAEIALIRKAVDISVSAHKRAMRTCSRLHNEYEVEAELLYEMSRQGCRSMAYEPIVGGGANACVLHYTKNDEVLKSGDLLLIDAGAEYGNYAADVTRTFPVSGVFSPEQRAIYELVYSAQQEAIACIKPGTLWSLPQQRIIQVLTAGLCELEILQGNVDELIQKEAYKPFYMHNSGHWLGLDVHDAGRYKLNNNWRELKAGMVLTVEPGLYITPAPEVNERWWNIGVRIEDDILVTEQGSENLSAALPATVNDIEALMRD